MVVKLPIALVQDPLLVVLLDDCWQVLQCHHWHPPKLLAALRDSEQDVLVVLGLVHLELSDDLRCCDKGIQNWEMGDWERPA